MYLITLIIVLGLLGFASITTATPVAANAVASSDKSFCGWAYSKPDRHGDHLVLQADGVFHNDFAEFEKYDMRSMAICLDCHCEFYSNLSCDGTGYFFKAGHGEYAPDQSIKCYKCSVARDEVGPAMVPVPSTENNARVH